MAIQGLGKAYRIAKENELDIIHTQTEFSLGLAGKLIAAMLRFQQFIRTILCMRNIYTILQKGKCYVLVMWRIFQIIL